MVGRRNRWLKRTLLWVSAIVFLAGVTAFALSDTVRYVVIVAIEGVTYGITSGKDVDEAAALGHAVVSRITAIHKFVRDSASRPGTPPIFVNPGSRAIFTQPPVIIVHEIKDRAE